MVATPWDRMNPVDKETVQRTGRWRPRAQQIKVGRWWRKTVTRYVVQVEWTAVRRPLALDDPAYNGSRDLVSRIDTWWVDATVEDLVALGRQIERDGGTTPPLASAA